MGSHQTHTLLVVSFLLFSSMILCYGAPNYVSSWCKNMPYPRQCEHYLGLHGISPPLNGKSDFLNAMVKIVMDHARRIHENAYSLSAESVDEKEKMVWADCLEMYDLAIQHLNRTMNTPRSSRVDAQTWLSSALTHFQTCLDGFDDLGVSKHVIPMSHHANISYLISNALAINHQERSPNNGISPAGDWAESKDGFPGWVKPGDRKLLQSSSLSSQANIVVAKDGSGDYKTIGEAIQAASQRSNGGRFVIHIKTGTYKENVEIRSNNIMLLGDGMGKTIITGSKSAGGGSTTYSTATVAVVGSGFIAQGITFQNTAGPSNQQAVALRSNSDLSVFYKCSIEGYQDTLYLFSNRQFYRECNIYGTVDFIFGNAAAVFQNCNIYVRSPPGGTSTITAQGRTDLNQNTGISIHNCRVTSAGSLNGAKTYLGRPWQKYSRTVFMKTYLDSIIDPKGWMEWSGNFALNTLYYGEYSNTGPGASTSNRVKWPGYHASMSASEAGKFTVGNFIGGNSWISKTGVPFTSGL